MSRGRKTPPPALSGLIRQLPAGAWSRHERALFLEAFTRCLDLNVPLNDGLVLRSTRVRQPDDAPPPIALRFDRCPDRTADGRQDRCGLFSHPRECTDSFCGRAGAALEPVESGAHDVEGVA